MQVVIEMSSRIWLRGQTLPWRVQHQSVRFFRKPKWVAIAPSKMYKIKDHPSQPKPEAEEMKRLMDAHRTYSKSLWLFQRQIYQEQVAKGQAEAREISEEGDMERILLENERDNAKVRALREQQIEEEWRRVEEDIIRQRTEKEEVEFKLLQQTEEKIQKEMERLKSAIRDEDLDEAIEKAMASEVDYNFAIDKDGKIYQGRMNNDKGESLQSLSHINKIKTSLSNSTKS